MRHIMPRACRVALVVVAIASPAFAVDPNAWVSLRFHAPGEITAATNNGVGDVYDGGVAVIRLGKTNGVQICISGPNAGTVSLSLDAGDPADVLDIAGHTLGPAAPLEWQPNRATSWWHTASGLKAGTVHLTATWDQAPTIVVKYTVHVLKVELNNTSHNGDLVVSAKDTARDLPGGEKELEIAVSPATVSVVLELDRASGSSGSAVFDSTGNDSRTVIGTQTVKILGRDVSDEPRNMQLVAKINTATSTTWDFTVFRVDPTPILVGDVTVVMPDSVTNSVGDKLNVLFQTPTAGNKDLGHKIENDVVAYGGIVIRGKIVPSDMDKTDFNTTHSRAESFITQSIN